MNDLLKILITFILVIASFKVFIGISNTTKSNNVLDGCISFQVSQGTGCDWMCNFCAENLGTSNYYFTDGVCKYQTGGCVGNPLVGKTYTCCSLNNYERL